MRCSSVCADKYTFPSLVKVCARELVVREGGVVHGLIVRCGVGEYVFVGSSLVDFYGKCREIECARKVFDEMSVRNGVSYTAMIVGYANVGDFEKAVGLFKEMPRRNVGSWNAMINVFVRLGDLGSARKLFDNRVGSLELAKWADSYVSQSSLDLRRPHVVAALVDMHAKCGNMERATMLFKKMPKQDLISYCSMIQGLTIHGCGPQAVALFSSMLSEWIIPDNVAFTVILSACSQAGLVEEGCHSLIPWLINILLTITTLIIDKLRGFV
ncbi:Pentatricopeptide repeat-containing protein [Heracleum sosnowskyi]|uniref:Pentatricopeptide repeat-containing protein n=1 Tax=Heracleum sosnowskyi TaxID=360622 RepID=A0AAD8MSD0_9APIA|nr:Pentatricopeptide repeat-containing protein [Heracleum sosnowskyi]